MAREGLRCELTAALRQAGFKKEIVRRHGLRVKTNGDFTFVNLTVCPVTMVPTVATEESPFLIILEEASDSERVVEKGMTGQPDAQRQAGDSADSADMAAQVRLETLQRELRAKEEYLQSALEELETANEELRSSNEEMQSVNEELQSANEELETSKEELQSVNEELATVNAELQTKVTDLSQANNDMNNLLAGTGIGTVFVDLQLRILRFTPAVTRIINLIVSDVGRPVSHIASNLVGYARLVEDIQAVLDNLIPKEVEVQTQAGMWYAMRIQPYRTMNNVIEGAVITFVDVTEMKKTQDALKQSEALLRSKPRDGCI
jgi:two-component system CheB/CheR fusion protein